MSASSCGTCALSQVCNCQGFQEGWAFSSFLWLQALLAQVVSCLASQLVTRISEGFEVLGRTVDGVCEGAQAVHDVEKGAF